MWREGCLDVWMAGGWMDGWLEEWMNGMVGGIVWMDEWMDGWAYRRFDIKWMDR